MPGHAYDRLSALDSSFLVYESPSDPMHVAATALYDAAPLRTPEGGVAIESIRAYVASRLHRIPRYRQRLAWVPLLDHPVWVDDPRFQIEYHVRHTRLPRPGSERQLKRLVGRILSQQLDRGKPLWEMWVVEGLEGDRFAVVTKTHHCMVDGVAGADLLAVLMTPEPQREIAASPSWVPRPAPGGAQLLVAEAWRRARLPLALAGALWRLARDEDHLRHDLEERGRALGRVLAAGARQASNTPLNQRVGPHRRTDWFDLAIPDVKEVRNALGGTLNDVVLATVAGGLRHFLARHRGVDVDRLDFRIFAPVSLRPRDARGITGNRVSGWLLPLPLDEPDPVRRLARVRHATEERKARKDALGVEALTRVPEWTGSGLLSLTARLMTWGQPFNLVVTNVPGPQLPLYLLDSRMLAIYPAVPLLGNLSLGIALFSYDGTLGWGLTADWDLVPDLHELARALCDAFAELAEAAAASGRKASPVPSALESARPPTEEGVGDGA